jgi:hypothetical protein
MSKNKIIFILLINIDHLTLLSHKKYFLPILLKEKQKDAN